MNDCPTRTTASSRIISGALAYLSMHLDSACPRSAYLAALLLGLSLGGTVLMMVLAASASYIAVPAAMRVALPEANPTLSLSLSLGITFPFNLMVGIPLYLAVAAVFVAA